MASVRVSSLLLVALFGACFPGPIDPEVGADGETTAEPDTIVTTADVSDMLEVDAVADVDIADTDEVPIDTETEVGPVLNVCGGAGVLPGEPGEACGDCADGELACDDADPNDNSVTCVGASALNACGGCGTITPPLDAACDVCGLRKCDPEGGTAVVCVSPVGGCTEPLTCEDLGCQAQGRACTETSGEDAVCGACLATHALVGAACEPRALTPTGASASIDRASDVEIRWQTAAHATGYHVERCDVASCATPDWERVTPSALATTTFIDDAVALPAIPGAPAVVTASSDRSDRVAVGWSAVVAPAAPRYRYRVVAVGAGGESAPSEVVVGGVAERPLTAYELRVDGGAWVDIGLVTSHVDLDAAPPTLVPATATASLGTDAQVVELAATPATPVAGAIRTYQVRASTAYGPAAASETASGHRVAGPITYQWQRSAAASAEQFSALPGATTLAFDDAGAPADGSIRWYRLVASAQGASDALSEAVAGSRQPPPGVPGGVVASSDLGDRVLATWEPVSEALGYHVYRNGTKLTTGTGVVATSFADLDAPAPSTSWQAPSNVTATTTDSDKVVVSWTAPAQPLGAATTYHVSAVNAAGEGTQSASATGRRVGPALAEYEVEVKPTGGNAVWTATGDTTASFVDATAPAGAITPGTIAVTQGAHRAHVRLTSTGAAANAGADVTYRVRAKLVGASPGPASTSVIGRRAVGPLTLQWQRSSGTSATGFADLTGATTATFNDTTAPTEGAKRWYQLVLGASGVSSRTVGPSEGWRLAFVTVSLNTGLRCALTNDGRIWCWGGASMVASTPVPFPSGVSAFTQVVAADLYTCARSNNGDTYCWGNNDYGQLGDGTYSMRADPVKVATNTATSVAADWKHTCIGGNAGARCWGDNPNGELGNNTIVASPSPVSVVIANGSQLTSVAEVSVGASHSCARRTLDVYCWGRNLTGQLGLGSTGGSRLYAVPVTGVSSTAQLTGGSSHTCVRVASGEVRCWGQNDSGQLGDGTKDNRNAPVIVPGVTASTIAAGGNTTCAVSTTGTVWCWGEDGTGQLGNGGPKVDSTTPVQVLSVSGATALGVGFEAACAVANHVLQCWGGNHTTTTTIALP